MVVLDQFYQIVEKKSSDISVFWKLLHTGICFFSAGCAFLTSFCFGRLLEDFSYNCILNAKIVFDKNTYLNRSQLRGVEDKLVHTIDLSDTVWGTTSNCNFVQFTPLIMMISAIVWGVYFGIMSKGGAGERTDLLARPWSILYPCILFTTIFFIIYVASIEQLKNGLTQFCNTFKPELNNTGCTVEIEMYTIQFIHRHILFGNFYPNMLVAVTSGNVGILSWLLQLVICIIRVFVVADFDLQLVTVMSKEEEMLESVIELAGDDDDDDDDDEA